MNRSPLSELDPGVALRLELIRTRDGDGDILVAAGCLELRLERDGVLDGVRKGELDDSMETLRFRAERGGVFIIEGYRAATGSSTMVKSECANLCVFRVK